MVKVYNRLVFGIIQSTSLGTRLTESTKYPDTLFQECHEVVPVSLLGKVVYTLYIPYISIYMVLMLCILQGIINPRRACAGGLR